LKESIKEGELSEYLTLDLDADKMKEDIEDKLGIKVSAKYFDLKEIEDRVNKNV